MYIKINDLYKLYRPCQVLSKDSLSNPCVVLTLRHVKIYDTEGVEIMVFIKADKISVGNKIDIKKATNVSRTEIELADNYRLGDLTDTHLSRELPAPVILPTWYNNYIKERYHEV